MVDIPRTKFGIQELDKALDGGFPQNNIVLLSGGAGTGKSTISLQYLVNGAKIFGERGLYITTEQNDKELAKVAANFGWKLDELQKSNFIRIRYLDVIKGDSFMDVIKAECQDFQPKRIVIDSLTTLTDSLLMSDMNNDIAFSMVKVSESVNPVPRTEKVITKTVLYHLISLLKTFNATAILTTELPEETKFLSADEVSEFICDGVMLLNFLVIGSSSFRSLRIRKMRYTNHSQDVLKYEFGPEGVELKPEDDVAL